MVLRDADRRPRRAADAGGDELPRELRLLLRQLLGRRRVVFINLGAGQAALEGHALDDAEQSHGDPGLRLDAGPRSARGGAARRRRAAFGRARRRLGRDWIHELYSVERSDRGRRHVARGVAERRVRRLGAGAAAEPARRPDIRDALRRRRRRRAFAPRLQAQYAFFRERVGVLPAAVKRDLRGHDARPALRRRRRRRDLREVYDCGRNAGRRRAGVGPVQRHGRLGFCAVADDVVAFVLKRRRAPRRPDENGAALAAAVLECFLRWWRCERDDYGIRGRARAADVPHCRGGRPGCGFRRSRVRDWDGVRAVSSECC
mmetsp:Transcript_6296/g.19882  ORF Transcript_6296/g.19882 Transcript_6296/m.19882 type:complete len:317 (-) Transcript_6296:9-959(-)